MSKKSQKQFVDLIGRLLFQGRLQVTIGKQGFTVNADSALAIVAAIAIIAMLLH
jgi:hypothetical protein